MLVMRVPVLIRVLVDVLDLRCKIKWAVAWLLARFSGGLIQCADVMSPGCRGFADSTADNSSFEVGLNAVGTNSTRIG